MDFFDKTMASLGSACLGEVPAMVMNSTVLEGTGGRGGERGRGFYLTWNLKHGREISSKVLFNSQMTKEGTKRRKEVCLFRVFLRRRIFPLILKSSPGSPPFLLAPFSKEKCPLGCSVSC